MNLYVSNLGEQITDESLRAVFATHGEVNSTCIIRDILDGSPRGFGYVEMPDAGEARKAVSKINGQVLDGRSIRVEEAKGKAHPAALPGRRPDMENI